MLLLDQMSGGHVVGRNVFSTTFLLLPLTYAHAFSLPSSSPEGHRCPLPSLPRFNTKESVWNRILPACNYRSTIQDKVQRVWKCTLHVQLFNELHCWINDLSRQQCSLCYACVIFGSKSVVSRSWGYVILNVFLREVEIVRVKFCLCS